MTRNEMVRKIADTLPFIIANSNDNALKIADRILEVVENLGMKPPEVKDPVLFRKENRWETRE